MNLELPKELENEINLLLSELTEFNNCSVTKGTPKIRNKAFNFAKALNLIRPKVFSKSNSYELDEKGIFAIQDGGIEKYLENIKVGKDLDGTIKTLTSRRLENDVKNNLLYILLGGFIGLITSISTTVLTLKVTPDNTIKYIEQLNKLTSEKTERDYNLQKHLNDMNIELSLLKNQIDSLKIKKSE